MDILFNLYTTIKLFHILFNDVIINKRVFTWERGIWYSFVWENSYILFWHSSPSVIVRIKKVTSSTWIFSIALFPLFLKIGLVIPCVNYVKRIFMSLQNKIFNYSWISGIVLLSSRSFKYRFIDLFVDSIFKTPCCHGRNFVSQVLHNFTFYPYSPLEQ